MTTRAARYHRNGRRTLAILRVVLIGMLGLLGGIAAADAKETTMLVRLSEIEIHPQHLQAYMGILKDEAEASVRLEPGVVCIFPASLRDEPSTIRILEIYASREAYEAHLQTPHFRKYKTSTLPMVKSLRLVDLQEADAATMPLIFSKLRPPTET